MPFNLTKKYNDLLDLLGMSERELTESLRRIFNRDIDNNPVFTFNGKPIYPTPREDGKIAMENLFNHLTRKEVDQETHHREFDMSRSQRLHWIRHHVEQRKNDNMLYFSVAEPRSERTYIYDMDEKYVIVLEPRRNCVEFSLYFCSRVDCRHGVNNRFLVKCATVHNCVLFNPLSYEQFVA